jgi:hypothetical protein
MAVATSRRLHHDPGNPRPTPLDPEKQYYVVRCCSCGLALPVTGATAAGILVARHLASSRVCPQLGCYAEPVYTVEQLRERGRKRVRR